MSVRTLLTNSEEETIQAGREFARTLTRPAVVLLIGNLGAGKTAFTKGLADELGAADADEVTSPTFTLVHEYGSDVWHLDLYRLDTEAEIASLGLEDLLSSPTGIVIVEWAEKFLSHFPPDAWTIHLEVLPNNRRSIEIRSGDTSLLSMG